MHPQIDAGIATARANASSSTGEAIDEIQEFADSRLSAREGAPSVTCRFIPGFPCFELFESHSPAKRRATPGRLADRKQGNGEPEGSPPGALIMKSLSAIRPG